MQYYITPYHKFRKGRKYIALQQTILIWILSSCEYQPPPHFFASSPGAGFIMEGSNLNLKLTQSLTEQSSWMNSPRTSVLGGRSAAKTDDLAPSSMVIVPL